MLQKATCTGPFSTVLLAHISTLSIVPYLSLGEFRTLWRLDNGTFISAYNADKDGVLPPLSEYAVSTKIQDETWKTPEGGYLTKYDWSFL